MRYEFEQSVSWVIIFHMTVKLDQVLLSPDKTMIENYFERRLLVFKQSVFVGAYFYYKEMIQFTSNENILSRVVKRILIKNNLYGSRRHSNRNKTRALKGKESDLSVSRLFVYFFQLALSFVEFAFPQDKMRKKIVITQMNLKDKGNNAIKIKQ